MAAATKGIKMESLCSSLSIFLDSKFVGSIVSDLEVEALSTAMISKLKLEVCCLLLCLVLVGSFCLYCSTDQ